jgi:hypothetical protein
MKKESEPPGTVAIETEPIFVPVPGQPGEMEVSIENYPTPEDFENSRKKFTDSAGWVFKTDDKTKV